MIKRHLQHCFRSQETHLIGIVSRPLTARLDFLAQHSGQDELAGHELGQGDVAVTGEMGDHGVEPGQ